MTQKRLTSTKALSAYFLSRQSTLSIALAQVGIMDQAYLSSETPSDDIFGLLPRRFGLTPEQLIARAEAHATA
jgi:hypothetical protein